MSKKTKRTKLWMFRLIQQEVRERLYGTFLPLICGTNPGRLPIIARKGNFFR
jgi:hypothetical protein